MATYEEIFENNRRWADAKRSADPAYFDALAHAQDPEYLYIGCSDSRVPANEIMGVGPGEVFVHRNVANVVANTDLNAAAVIDYAVQHLKVRRIIVCGHYGCGGVKAAMQARQMGILDPWLRNIRDVYRLHREELDGIENPQERYARLVEISVVEQCLSVIKFGVVQESFQKNGYPSVHAWVFDLATGLIRDLKVNFRERLKDLQSIYNVTDKSWFRE